MRTTFGVLLIGLLCLTLLGCQKPETTTTFGITPSVVADVQLFSVTVDGKTKILYGPPQNKWKDGKYIISYPLLQVGSGKFTDFYVKIDDKASSVEVNYNLETGEKWTLLPVYPGPWSDVSWNISPITLNRTFNSMASAKSYISVTDLHKDGCFFLGGTGAFKYALDKRILCSQIKDVISKNPYLEVLEEFKPIEVRAVNTISISAYYRVASGDKGSVKLFYLVRPLTHTGQ